jgi:predicted metalloprotease
VVRRAALLVLVAGAFAAACSGIDSGVEVGVAPITSDDATEIVDPTEPSEPEEPVSTISVPIAESELIHLAGDKPPQPYDDFLAGAVEDIDSFWRDAYPEIAGGEPYTPLEGGVWPVWPSSGSVPGCGSRETSFRDVANNAFYCFDGDFIAFDDEHLFPEIYDTYGQLVVGIVMAHEWGHSIQARRAYQLDPVIYELQADCFAGAWVQHLATDEEVVVRVDDDALGQAVSGVIAFRDDPGITSNDAGAHGSAFDRVSAFNDGYTQGASVCDSYEASPPTPLQLPFRQGDRLTGGNMAYDELVAYDPQDENGSLPESLDDVWIAVVEQAGSTFTSLGPTLTEDADCDGDDPAAIGYGVEYCPDARTVSDDDDSTRQLHTEIGDFTVGLLYAEAWAEAAQDDLGLELAGDAAEEQRDCMAGVYVGSIFPGRTNEIYPEGPVFRISAGDLDEAVQMLLLLTQEDDRSAARALERLDAFRSGLVTTLRSGVFPAFDFCTEG